MSLLEEINRKKLTLTHTSTTVIHEDGRVFLEEFKNGNQCRIELSNKGQPGYVVDTKPDMQIAEILPGLFLGSQDPANDVELLKSFGISHVLSIGVQVEPPPNAGYLSYTYIQAFDLPEFDITSIFERCFELIDSVLEVKGSIYVHCNAGTSRAPIVVIGYLIKQHGYSYENALNLVKSKRPSIAPNPGFIKQVKLYYLWLNYKG